MENKTFTKGQTVYLKIIKDSKEYKNLLEQTCGNLNITDIIIKSEIKSITKKYITVSYNNIKFDIAKGYKQYRRNCLEPDFDIFENIEDTIDDDCKELLWKLLKSKSNLPYLYNCPYTLKQFKDNMEILGIKNILENLFDK